jgi:hypothetical protein
VGASVPLVLSTNGVVGASEPLGATTCGPMASPLTSGTRHGVPLLLSRHQPNDQGVGAALGTPSSFATSAATSFSSPGLYPSRTTAIRPLRPMRTLRGIDFFGS